MPPIRPRDTQPPRNVGWASHDVGAVSFKCKMEHRGISVGLRFSDVGRCFDECGEVVVRHRCRVNAESVEIDGVDHGLSVGSPTVAVTVAHGKAAGWNPNLFNRVPPGGRRTTAWAQRQLRLNGAHSSWGAAFAARVLQ